MSCPTAGVMVGDEQGVRIIDAVTGSRLATVRRPHEDGGLIWGLDVSETGERVALVTINGISVVDVATGDRVFTVPWGNADWMWDMAWSPDDAHLAIAFASGDPARSLVVVDQTGASLGPFPEIRGYNTRTVSFSADGRSLATTRWGIDTVDPTLLPVRIWDLESRKVVREIDATAELTEFAPTGELIASSRPVEGVAEVWEAETGDLLATLTATAHVRELSFDAAGNRLATAHADGTVRLWDPRTGAQELVLEVGTRWTPSASPPTGPSWSPRTSMARSGSGPWTSMT